MEERMEEIKITDSGEAKNFIEEQVSLIKERVGDKKAIGFVSGGVDSSVVALLASRALSDNFQAFFIENGLMREGEATWVKEVLKEAGISVEVIEVVERFFLALERKFDSFSKRVAIRHIFYEEILPQLASKIGAGFLFQGTNLTDVQATTVNSVAPQHNILCQIGIDIGIEVVEPLSQLRKPSIRLVARELGFPKPIWDRMPFPGPALAARICGEVTPEKVGIIRKVTKIVERELETQINDLKLMRGQRGFFQCFPVLLQDWVPNNNRTKFGLVVAIVFVNSQDGQTAVPVDINNNLVKKLSHLICKEVPEVFRVCWDFSSKPPAAIEWQ